jgi:predicted Zn-dependent protease
MFKTSLKLTVLTLSAALLASCGSAVNNPVTGQAERSVMSEAAEIAEGKKSHAQVLEEYGVLKNPRVQAYVNGIGQQLAKQSQRANLQWTFTVLDSPEINAFALPGGYVYITRGIMVYLESEADLAGVIGHEIGHVTARHGAQRATRQQDAGLGVLAASILGAVLEAKGVGGAGQMASDLSQTVAAGYVSRYGREQELQADGLGAEYLSRIRFDPRNMIDVINVLKNQERFAADLARSQGRPVPEQNSWLSSHPSNDQRLSSITQLAAQYKTTAPYNDEGRARYQQILEGMAFGESAEQGLTRGRNFYHTGLGFALTAADGWRIQNEPEQITLVNSTGDAGLVVKMAPPDAGKTHDEIIRKLVNPATGRAERVQINGLAATRFTGTVAGKNGQAQNTELTLITSAQGNVFLFIHAAKDAATLQRNRGQMLETENTFRALTPADKAAARPWMVRSALMPRGGFAELARTSPLANPEQQLRLINGVYPAGDVKVGAPVKTVVQQ